MAAEQSYHQFPAIPQPTAMPRRRGPRNTPGSFGELVPYSSQTADVAGVAAPGLDWQLLPQYRGIPGPLAAQPGCDMPAFDFSAVYPPAPATNGYLPMMQYGQLPFFPDMTPGPVIGQLDPSAYVNPYAMNTPTDDVFNLVGSGPEAQHAQQNFVPTDISTLGMPQNNLFANGDVYNFVEGVPQAQYAQQEFVPTDVPSLDISQFNLSANSGMYNFVASVPDAQYAQQEFVPLDMSTLGMPQLDLLANGEMYNFVESVPDAQYAQREFVPMDIPALGMPQLDLPANGEMYNFVESVPDAQYAQREFVPMDIPALGLPQLDFSAIGGPSGSTTPPTPQQPATPGTTRRSRRSTPRTDNQVATRRQPRVTSGAPRLTTAVKDEVEQFLPDDRRNSTTLSKRLKRDMKDDEEEPAHNEMDQILDEVLGGSSLRSIF